MILITKGTNVKLRKTCVLLKMITLLLECQVKTCWKISTLTHSEICISKNTVSWPKVLEKPTSFVTTCSCFVDTFSFLPFLISGTHEDFLLRFKSWFIFKVCLHIHCFHNHISNHKGTQLLETNLCQNHGNLLVHQSKYFTFLWVILFYII